MNFKFGEMILVRNRIKRTRGEDKYKGPRTWIKGDPFNPPKKAIFLGKKHLWDGIASFDPEDGREWTNTKHHKGALICIEGLEPEKVFYEDLEIYTENNATLRELIEEMAAKIREM